MARKSKKTHEPQTTLHRLGSLIKSCRDIMRKDKGLNGDLDRLPQLTWILFLKFLDDLALQDEVSADLAGKEHQSLIPPPYRWRDWAAQADGMTGDELLAFINNDEAVRPDGTRGPGLFAMLRGLQGAEGGDRRDVIARVFSGTNNRMINGYLIRDVVNKVDDIHFSSTDELHTLSALYESMLREMRDAAGDSGEFYTPRPVVRLMVELVDPQLGETVLDPACGTGGFLVEAFEHMKGQVRTTAERDQLQRRTLFGGEAKSLPYLLAEMNLLLHGVEVPNVDFGNSLAVKLTEIGDRERVDVVLTNPPFGGEEERSIQANFPATLQTSETALLFLQLIMRKLRRPGPRQEPGRAAVVVPNPTLYGDRACARLKAVLLADFNLHTIVRLPDGVFEPYTPIPTNLLFFDRSRPTSEIWFYEHPLPEGVSKYSKTKPLRYSELKPLIDWWADRRETDFAWKVQVDEVLQRGDDGEVVSCNLDLVNPKALRASAEQPPRTVLSQVRSARDALTKRLDRLEGLYEDLGDPTWTNLPLEDLLTPRADTVSVEYGRDYPMVGVYSFGRGLFFRGLQPGGETSYKNFYRLHEGDLVLSRLFGWEGALGVVPPELHEHFVSKEFPSFFASDDRVDLRYVAFYFTTPMGLAKLRQAATGLGQRRQRVKEDAFLEIEFPFPPRRIQSQVADILAEGGRLTQQATELQNACEALGRSILNSHFSLAG